MCQVAVASRERDLLGSNYVVGEVLLWFPSEAPNPLNTSKSETTQIRSLYAFWNKDSKFEWKCNDRRIDTCLHWREIEIKVGE